MRQEGRSAADPSASMRPSTAAMRRPPRDRGWNPRRSTQQWSGAYVRRPGPDRSSSQERRRMSTFHRAWGFGLAFGLTLLAGAARGQDGKATEGSATEAPKA